MKTDKQPTMTQRLKQLVKESDLTLSHIAESSGVKYLTLQRWMKTRSQSIKLDDAEALWEYFTGQKFQ